MTVAVAAFRRVLSTRPRVLVIADEPHIVLELQNQLANEFDLQVASNIEHALDMMRANAELAAVIADQRVSEVDGAQILEQISRIGEIPRILLARAGDANVILRAVNDAHVSAVMMKPWDADQLRTALRRAIDTYATAMERACAHELLSALMANAPDAIYFKDHELRYLHANHACAKLHCLTDPALLQGKCEGELNPQAGGGATLESHQRIVLDGEPAIEHVSSYEREGATYWLSTQHTPWRNERGEVTGLIGIARDITARKRQEEQVMRQAARLNMLAQYDELTQLPKRDLLMDRLTQRLETASAGGGSVAIILIDIDHFRRITASLGRDAGEALLFAMVSRLRPLLGSDDTLARLDGSTFAWLVTDARDAAHVAQKLEHDVLPRLRAPFLLDEAELRVSCRVAVALGPSDGESAEQLTRHAEAALHKAAVTNQPYVFYAPVMNERVAERLSLETRLRRAIENEEFVLYYQPKLELRTGQIAGLEALIRWQDPQHGLIPPGSFIPILEETGLILDVGRWVYRAAAKQYIAWREQGLTPPPIAVNVSSLELGQNDFLDAIEHARSDYPGADGGVELEITESVLMDDLQGNIEKLRSVRQRGLRVAIDDFGTGYSSLGYLSRLPIDALKIDRSFVIRMTDDPQDMTIVMAIISLAHALDLKVIAEGPETVQQAQLLRLLKCDQIQGYVVARPQPANDVAQLLGKTLSFAPGALTAH